MDWKVCKLLASLSNVWRTRVLRNTACREAHTFLP